MKGRRDALICDPDLVKVRRRAFIDKRAVKSQPDAPEQGMHIGFSLVSTYLPVGVRLKNLLYG